MWINFAEFYQLEDPYHKSIKYFNMSFNTFRKRQRITKTNPIAQFVDKEY